MRLALQKFVWVATLPIPSSPQWMDSRPRFREGMLSRE